MTTPDTIAKAFRKLDLMPRQRAKRARYGGLWCAAQLGDEQAFEMLAAEAARSGKSVEVQLLAWIDNPTLARDVLSRLSQKRQPQTVMDEDQLRGHQAESEWRGMTNLQLYDWKWRRYLAEQVATGHCAEEVAKQNHTTVEQVQAAVAEFAGVSA